MTKEELMLGNSQLSCYFGLPENLSLRVVKPPTVDAWCPEARTAL
jgi:hypothetical protein